jgi:SAM-dependent methyltransferase
MRFHEKLSGLWPRRRPLPDLIAERPESYRRSGDFLIFHANSPDDFDWMERRIQSHGFYERPGPWGYGIDKDKAVLGSFVAALGVEDMLELGCGDGGTLACASHLGVRSAGLDISAFARSKAKRKVRRTIRLGDLLEVHNLPKTELVCAFDLIEHISPNKLDAYLSKIADLLKPGGVVVFNTPAFGDDRIFGLVHTYWLEEWREEERRAQLWRHFPCDQRGYPLMGHLVWADSVWWENLFERHGLKRLETVERALHAKFDDVMSYSEARRSYFVLGKDKGDARERGLEAAVGRFDLQGALERCASLIDR